MHLIWMRFFISFPHNQLMTIILPCKHHPPFVLQFDHCDKLDCCCQVTEVMHIDMER